MLQALRGFHEDQAGGERDTLTTLLILALIIVPLVLLIITFGDKAKQLATDAWNTVTGSGVN
jgi:predicted GTPase